MIMCFGGRDKGDADVARSRDIDKTIKQDEKRLAKEIKLLLLGTSRQRFAPMIPPSAAACIRRQLIRVLTSPFWPVGAGESGKSTILKQMKLIYSQGFSDHEKLEWKPVIFNNIVQSFKTISEAMTELSIDFENPENEVGPLSCLGVHPNCCRPAISCMPREVFWRPMERRVSEWDINTTAAVADRSILETPGPHPRGSRDKRRRAAAARLSRAHQESVAGRRHQGCYF